MQRAPQRLELGEPAGVERRDLRAAHRPAAYRPSGLALARLQPLARALQHVDRLVHERGDLLEQRGGLLGIELARLQAGAQGLQVGGQLLQPGLVYVPTPCSRATRPRMPFTSAPASGEA